jgi:hypothetical protein
MPSHTPSIAISTGLNDGTAPGSAGKPWINVTLAALAGMLNKTKMIEIAINNGFLVMIFLLSVFDKIDITILLLRL